MVHEQVVNLTVLWIYQHTKKHCCWSDRVTLAPLSHHLCVELPWVRRELEVGGVWGVAPPLSGAHWAPLAPRPAAYHPEAAGSHKGPRWRESRVNVTNTRSLIPLPCTSAPGQFQKPDPLFFSKIPPSSSSCTTSFLFSHCYSAAGERTAFVVAHSVTQTQDLRLPVIKWKLSLGFSQRSLCSCRLEERGGNSYFSTWKGSRRGHEGRLFTSDTIDFESRCFSESGRECLPGCWHHVLIEFDCQQVSKGPKQAYYENALLGSSQQQNRRGRMAFRRCRNHRFKLLHK